jgi:hypothetical protein
MLKIIETAKGGFHLMCKLCVTTECASWMLLLAGQGRLMTRMFLIILASKVGWKLESLEMVLSLGILATPSSVI